MRLNLTLDDEHAEALARLAQQAHLQPGTIARSLLLTALDRAVEQEERDHAPRNVLEVLDGIDGAFDRMALARRSAAEGNTIPLDQL